MKTRTFLVIALAALPATAWAEDHTASWFAAHPREMDAQIASCLDDPGHARLDPNCENATQGQLNRDLADARAHVAAMNAEGLAQQEQLWRANPQALLIRLKICNAAPSAAVRQNWDCDQAFAVAQQMTGHRR